MNDRLEAEAFQKQVSYTVDGENVQVHKQNHEGRVLQLITFSGR
jgi:hypothetical protein